MLLPYLLSGIVVIGNQLGRTIGFPTANILPDPRVELQLKHGVYAVSVLVKGKYHWGMANVGIKPTVGLHKVTIEVNIFDFDQDIYGEKMDVTFYEYVREERRFSGLETLKEQIEKDKLTVKEILAKRG